MLPTYGQIYQQNQKLCNLIPPIIRDYRAQHYNIASRNLRVMTETLGEVVAALSQPDEPVSATIAEALGTLPPMISAFVEAQENQDYALLADIMEGDLLPALQQLQLDLEPLVLTNPADDPAESTPEAADASDDAAELWRALSALPLPQGYELCRAINGQPNLLVHSQGRQIHFHSTINPGWEADQLATDIMRDTYVQYVVFGIGLGYHIRELLRRDALCRVTVLETKRELVEAAGRNMRLGSREAGRLEIHCDPDPGALLQYLKEEQENTCFLIFYPSLQVLPKDAYREKLEYYYINTNAMQWMGRYLHENFAILQEKGLPEWETLRPVMEQKKVVVIGGGPSVNENLPHLREHRSEYVIFATGRILRTLLANGITPDLAIITDPLPVTMHQLETVPEEVMRQVPLILLATTYHELVDVYKGQVYLAYQEGFEGSERTAKEHGYYLCQTGGSVSTTALDLALAARPAKVILLGMDMAFTDGQTHATGAHASKVTDTEQLQRVISTTGEYVYTTNSLNRYRKWMEGRIAREKEILVENVGRGADIAGTKAIIHL